jgi:hypothetical protein
MRVQPIFKKSENSMNPATASVYQGLVATIKAWLFSDEFKDRHRHAKKDFTRQRCLPFVIVVIFLLNMVKRVLQDELDEFFKLLNQQDVAVRIVTKSAFSQARKKLRYDAFVELNQIQVDYFYEHFECKRWYGFRLLAVDGSTSQLPRTAEVAKHFGAWHPAQGDPCPLARVSQMFDVLNDVTLEALISPKETGERTLAARHFDHLTRSDLVLIDRGYPAFWLFALLVKQGAQFCARMPLGGWQPVERFVASGLSEQTALLWPSSESIQECRSRGLSPAPIKVRLMRVELDSGEVEVLATSLLDGVTYPTTVFKELYHQRWPVEENYKVMKSRIETENFTGKSVLAVYQDFHAKVFTTNLTAILAHPAQKVVEQESRGRKYIYQVNMTNALSKMKDTVVLLVQRTTILPLLECLWQVITQTIEPIRPGRSCPRNKRVRPRRFPMAYKPVR